MTENHFKTRLLRHEVQIGLWLALADAYSTEICAGSGFDWLLIDGEHAPPFVRVGDEDRAGAPRARDHDGDEADGVGAGDDGRPTGVRCPRS